MLLGSTGGGGPTCNLGLKTLVVVVGGARSGGDATNDCVAVKELKRAYHNWHI